MPPDFKYLEVKRFQEFFIPLAGLSAGEHRYDFTIDDAFFAHIPYSEIEKGQLKVDLLLDKRDNMLELTFFIDGWVEVPCDRCNDPFKLFLNGENSLYIKYGESYLEESEEVIVIPTDQHQFDTSHLLYEYIMLLLPIRRVHPDDENGNNLCNPEVIEKLNQHQAVTEIDPRWEMLKKLKDNS